MELCPVVGLPSAPAGCSDAPDTAGLFSDDTPVAAAGAPVVAGAPVAAPVFFEFGSMNAVSESLVTPSPPPPLPPPDAPLSAAARCCIASASLGVKLRVCTLASDVSFELTPSLWKTTTRTTVDCPMRDSGTTPSDSASCGSAMPGWSAGDVVKSPRR